LRARAISLYLFITSLDTVLNIASLAGHRVSVGGEPQVPGIRYPSMINGLPVVAAPAEIDVTTAEKAPDGSGPRQPPTGMRSS
jgi:hypothetical protein